MRTSKDHRRRLNTSLYDDLGTSLDTELRSYQYRNRLVRLLGRRLWDRINDTFSDKLRRRFWGAIVGRIGRRLPVSLERGI